MKIHLFFFILLFWATILPAKKKYPQYGSLDLRRECRKGNGRCRVECHESEIRIAFCIRPGSHCCLQK
ncbi:beta-defensin 110 [Lutra lutra]|uniref:Beta-defensin n=2 Tax=Mustelidae TaxID=9655 RepID=A0A2Y9K3D5_ENHLU|nr:beta-defensin 110 [Enhydra lutris kenyoni]XP_032194266.1 beta-defensin 110 [Mustela erminea]XP_032720454.1 beta-defensin 110 isoform X1 [Lontra canadensis]XP_044093560.1 beta-defensin 110 [Neogale vison]XP_045860318.1 beta-defensin 110 [Meles meles]XP_047588347.1 beta-defensin 110 [Lutra lutra]XP_059032359.1 beta-defensin 110 [Mustela lutreola]KAI5766767.1 DEFB110-like protein [Gulo gulo luscus]KAI5766889.1 DEFB110-like protein [Gulo gulo luscus]UQT06075.1 DEFB110 [Gulo gulo luscus]